MSAQTQLQCSLLLETPSLFCLAVEHKEALTWLWLFAPEFCAGKSYSGWTRGSWVCSNRDWVLRPALPTEMPSPHQLQYQRQQQRLHRASAASPMRSECFPRHSPPPPQIRRERQRERERQWDREKETERERYSERHTRRKRQRQAESVCVFLTQSSLPGSSVCVTPWTVARQAPLSMGFPRQENWSGWPFPSLGDLLDPGIETTSPEFPSIGGGFFTTAPPGKPLRTTAGNYPDDSNGEWNSRQKRFSAFLGVRLGLDSTLRLGINGTLRGASETFFVGLPWWSSGWESVLQCRGHGLDPWSRN